MLEDHRPPIEPDLSQRPKQDRLLVGLCAIQAAVAIVAAMAIYWHVESITISGPIMALLGLVIAFFSLQRDSFNLLLFGITCPIVTGLVALLIAFFKWDPDEAKVSVWILLTLNAIVMTLWGVVVVWRLLQASDFADTATVENRPYRFSVLTALKLMTFICVTLAIARNFTANDEMSWFFLFGLGVWLLSAAAFAKFWMQTASRESATIVERIEERSGTWPPHANEIE